MGLFDSKWIVEFEVSKGILSFNKKGTMVVEASSEYSAERKAKAALNVEYSYVKILSAHKSGGRNEESKTTYSPKTTTIKYGETNVNNSNRDITPEEREAYRVRRRQEEEALKQERKLNDIKKKSKAYKKAHTFHIRATILSGILSLIAFLLGWIPHWIGLIKAAASQTQLDMWIELGHSETDETGQEFAANIVRYSSEARSVMWIPFVILGVGIVITILVFYLARKKTPKKIEIAKKELDNSIAIYENEYGKLLIDKEKLY